MEIVYYKNGYVIMDGDKVVYADKNKDNAENMLALFESIPPHPPTPPEPPQPQVEHISREDFDLLDVTYKAVTYYITEEDGAITMRQGEE